MQKVEIGKKIRDLDERESFEILWVKEIHIRFKTDSLKMMETKPST